VLAVVRAAQGGELAEDEILSVRRALLAAVERAHSDHTWDSLDPDVRESLLACMVEEDPCGPPGEPAKLAAELLDLRRVTGRQAAAREVLEAITERLTSGRPQPRVLIVATAEALFDEGQRDKAFQLLHADYARMQIEYGEDDPRTRPALHNLAAAHYAAARAIDGQPESAPLYKTAITLYEKLLDARVKALPGDSEKVIATRKQYAQLLADCYRYPDAITQGEILLDEQNAARGPDHRETLTARDNLARWRNLSTSVMHRVAGFTGWWPPCSGAG
jgi:hypothetical protein